MFELCRVAREEGHLCPTELQHKRHGGQYDAEVKLVIHFKTKNVMQQHIYYIRYALRFADMQISELVSVFNDQVQNRNLTNQ